MRSENGGATSGETRYIVVRGTGEPTVDGKWFDREQIEAPVLPVVRLQVWPGLTCYSTGALEYREDGQFAEIYRPKGSYEKRSF